MDLNAINDLIEYIKEERTYQERKWGGFEHDSQYSFIEWLNIIDSELMEAGEAYYEGDFDQARRELVQAITVAFAALEINGPLPART